MNNQFNSQKLVSPANSLRIIKEFNSMKPGKVPISYLKEKIDLLLKGFAHTSIIIPTDWKGRLHRAISYPERPKHKKDLWYPPKEKAKLNRANLANNPMFYCSGNPKAVFFELPLKPGDMVVISQWALKEEILVSPMGYSIEAFERLNADRSCPIIVPDDKKHEREFNKTNIRITKFLHDIFTKIIHPGDEHTYKLTAAIADKFLTLQPDCGLVYPAVAMHGNAENFALTPSLVHNRLVFENAKWCRVDSIKDFSFTLTPLEFSDSLGHDDQLLWQPIPEHEIGYL